MVGFYPRKFRIIRKPVSTLLLVAFGLFSVVPPGTAQVLPAPGTIVSLSASFQPPVLLGLKVHPENPLLFDFIVDQGNTDLSANELKAETEKLIKYFLASLTIPEKEVWVNLSPYEKDRVIPDLLSRTEMGKQMLEQDYLLKQLASSLTNPDSELGRNYWQEVERRATNDERQALNDLRSTFDVPRSTFNKVWIKPQAAEVLESNGVVLVGEKRLAVLMQEDYESQSHTVTRSHVLPDAVRGTPDVRDLTTDVQRPASDVSSEVFRSLILPKIEAEVNTGKNFSQVRQIYNSVILAAWYKKALKESLLGQVYADKGKVAGVEIDDKAFKQQVYEQYLAAFTKGVYNLIKEEEDTATGELVPRKYFSGGAEFVASSIVKVNRVSAATITERLDSRTGLSLASTAVREGAETVLPITNLGIFINIYFPSDPQMLKSLKRLNAAGIDTIGKYIDLSDIELLRIDGVAFSDAQRIDAKLVEIQTGLARDKMLETYEKFDVWFKKFIKESLSAPFGKDREWYLDNNKETVSEVKKRALWLARQRDIIINFSNGGRRQNHLYPEHMHALWDLAWKEEKERPGVMDAFVELIGIKVARLPFLQRETLPQDYNEIFEAAKAYYTDSTGSGARGGGAKRLADGLAAAGIKRLKEAVKNEKNLVGKILSPVHLISLDEMLRSYNLRRAVQEGQEEKGEKKIEGQIEEAEELEPPSPSRSGSEDPGEGNEGLGSWAQLAAGREQSSSSVMAELVVEMENLNRQEEPIAAKLQMIAEFLESDQFKRGLVHFFEGNEIYHITWKNFDASEIRKLMPVFEKVRDLLAANKIPFYVGAAPSFYQLIIEQFNEREKRGTGTLVMFERPGLVGTNIEGWGRGQPSAATLPFMEQKTVQLPAAPDLRIVPVDREVVSDNRKPGRRSGTFINSLPVDVLVGKFELIPGQDGKGVIRYTPSSDPLIPGKGTAVEQEFELGKEYVVGRGLAGERLPLQFPDISGLSMQHFVVKIHEMPNMPGVYHFEVKDEHGSTNGTWIDAHQTKVRAASSTSVTDAVGGIDFDTSSLDLQIKRDGKGVPLPLPQQNLQQINIEGLYPVILNIVPVNARTLPLFLGQNNKQDPQAISPSAMLRTDS